MSVQITIDLQVLFAVIMGIGGIIMARKLLFDFFKLKHISVNDRLSEKSNQTPPQWSRSKALDQLGAFLFATGLILNIIGSIFWY